MSVEMYLAAYYESFFFNVLMSQRAYEGIRAILTPSNLTRYVQAGNRSLPDVILCITNLKE
jgi:hypothetical protein